MSSEMELPDFAKELERRNPRAFDMYRQEYLADVPTMTKVRRKNIEPIAHITARLINSGQKDVWKAFKEATQQLDDPMDAAQIFDLYNALYEKLEFDKKKKLAYYFAY